MSEPVVPIQRISGVDIAPNETGVAQVRVRDASSKADLSWDRYVRLQATANALLDCGATSILDVGGYDGALGLFLPDAQLDLIDPATTGGSVLDLPVSDASYQAVVAVDVLEHIEPGSREKALSELSRVSAQYVILNYPCDDSREAQHLVFELTQNTLIREHVEWALPDSNWVLEELSRHGFRGTVTPHASIAVWLGQYLTMALGGNAAAAKLNRHLVDNYSNENGSRSLYHLLVCQRA